jgi:hypothetical protein
MFNAEPEPQWTAEDKADFETNVTARNRLVRRNALKAGAFLLGDMICLVPFLAGFPLHAYWETGKYLLFLAFPLFLWFVLKTGEVWSSWQSARETRREFGDPI